jgi:hypothetical protein
MSLNLAILCYRKCSVKLLVASVGTAENEGDNRQHANGRGCNGGWEVTTGNLLPSPAAERSTPYGAILGTLRRCAIQQHVTDIYGPH